MRLLWGMCLAVAAMVTGVGIEMYAAGAGLISYPVVVAGVLMVPLASAGLERLEAVRAGSPQ